MLKNFGKKITEKQVRDLKRFCYAISQREVCS